MIFKSELFEPTNSKTDTNTIVPISVGTPPVMQINMRKNRIGPSVQ